MDRGALNRSNAAATTPKTSTMTATAINTVIPEIGSRRLIEHSAATSRSRMNSSKAL